MYDQIPISEIKEILLNSWGKGILVLDNRFAILYANDAFKKVMANLYQIEIALETSAFEVFAKTTRFLEIIKAFVPQIARTGEGKVKVQIKDQEVRIEGFTLQDEKGKIKGVAMLMDFSATEMDTLVTLPTSEEDTIEKKTITIRQTSENLELNVISASLPLPVVILDKNGKGYYYNQKMLEYTGLGQEELADNKWTFLVHPADDRKMQRLLTDLPLLSQEQQIDIRIRSKEGNYRSFMTKFTPIRSSSGAVERWYMIAMDIQDRLTAEIISNEKAHEFKVINETIPQMVWTAQPNKGINYVNQQLINFSGLSLESLLQFGWLALVHPQHSKGIEWSWYRSLNMGESYEEEMLLKRYDGEYRWVLSRALPLKNREGKVIKWYGTFTDIHDRKLLEIQKDEFVNIASHELKTPMTVLQAYLQLTAREVKVQPAQKYINKCLQILKKLNRLVISLLELSQNDNRGIAEINVRNFSINTLIYNTVADYRNITNHTFDIVTTPNDLVVGQVDKIEQVINNLLSNAIKYSNNNTIITITTMLLNDDFLQVSIEDQGRGIHKEKLEYIFDRFYRVDESATATGLGLGLYICKAIIEAHGGQIRVDSKPNKGSNFYFTIPLANEKSSPPIQSYDQLELE